MEEPKKTEWIAEEQEFATNGLVFNFKVSPKVYRRRSIIWGNYRTNYYNRDKDDSFNNWQKEIGQLYEYEYADLPQYMLKCPCVYILYNNDEVVYVGQTKQLGQRIRAHIYKEYNYAQIIHCANLDLRSKVEEFLIETYAPIYNRDYNPNPYGKTLSLVQYENEFSFLYGKSKRTKNYYAKELAKHRERYGIMNLYFQTKQLFQIQNTNPYNGGNI